MRTLHKVSTALVALAMIFAGVGCGQNAKNNANNAKINSLDQPSAKDLPSSNRESAGVLIRQDISRKLNTMSGLRSSSVLVHNGQAYVGVINVGREHTPDAAMQAGDTWNDLPWGTQSNPHSASGMSVQQMQAEGLDPAHTHDGPYSTITGNLDDATKKQIEDIVRANVKGVQQVHITGNVDQVQKLVGYKHFIARGGNMKPHLKEFNQFIQTSFGGPAPAQTQQGTGRDRTIYPPSNLPR